MKTFLHVGCGYKNKEKTTLGFSLGNWQEIRFDMEPEVKPDIVGSMLDMSVVESEAVDAVYSSHSIEHVYSHEVLKALHEMWRVLKQDGFAVITCPDLQSICALVVMDKLTEPAYIAGAGEIAPLDVIYGFRPFIAQGHTLMAHKTGFTKSTLKRVLQDAGFGSVITMQRGFAPCFDLWALATKRQCTDAELDALSYQHLPQEN